MSYLNNVNCPDDLKKLDVDQLNILAAEIRREILMVVSQNGGHLASNLGVVELTLALHRAFCAPADKIVWDVGHQTYTHKLICGRRNSFPSLRKDGGISGFPKRSESIYDVCETGHSSTAASIAMGLAAGRDISSQNHHVVCVVGDGALTGGLAYEALNHIGHTGARVIIVVNDNEMSISKNVGAISKFLQRLRTRKRYITLKKHVERFLSKTPLLGRPLMLIARKNKDFLRSLVTPQMVFEDLGCKYLGPCDGHNISELISVFSTAKALDCPVVIHALTKKGKGVDFAEQLPELYHAVEAFDIQTGNMPPGGRTYAHALGQFMMDNAEQNQKLTAVAAATPVSCGLQAFSHTFPNRFFDVGIAEGHAVTFAAGLALSGLSPVVCLYSSFLQRAYDEILHDVCLPNLHVVFMIDRAGFALSDGETHQGLFDICMMNHMPNMSILAPSCLSEFKQMLSYAVNVHEGPIALRYPKMPTIRQCAPFVFNVPELLRKGSDVTVCAVGNMTDYALLLAENLDMSVEVINLRTVKPLNMKFIEDCARKTGLLVLLEQSMMMGSVAMFIKSQLSDGIACIVKAVPDIVIPHGSIDRVLRLCEMDMVQLKNEIVLIKNRP